MALLVLTGGARSGKSSAAQRLALARQQDGAEVVVAVFGSAEDDAEMAERIGRHQADRPAGFLTIEAADSLMWRDEVPEDALLVVDCLGTLAARVMDEHCAAANAEATSTIGAERRYAIDDALVEMVAWLANRSIRADTIVVTNEVGLGVVPSYASGRAFRDALGRANAHLVALADRAYLVVSGRMLDLTALPADVPWHTD
ncbi:MAG: bifunctional adenosylcobinamide kinase/adenosylcobinamide-phosphate guanylyltransferase [Coriobacteriia bacterium]|jgi:adenosylcobinamide kinase/adenosylcobinamide-phosphate guanylyltransferase|nr:bifunctional adenosylcobinamide kinase/adenosylcobinamide-phosphate guanylyltransferase [Coriobacteriia bacterium]